MIGNEATITIESFFFGIQDHFDQIKYYFVPPEKQVFLKSQSPAIPISQQNNFDLSPIPLMTSFTPLIGEGVWTAVDLKTKTTIMAKTFVRPDKKRPYAFAALVKMDMSKLAISAAAGTREPGGVLQPGPGLIPSDIQKSDLLVAAFNGGFQQKDGHYGMIVAGKTYLPLLSNFATFVMYANKQPEIIRYDMGQKLNDGVMAIRQNGPLLLENSKIVTSLNIWNMQTWGLTTTNNMYTWRSGIGVTKNGDLIYAAGPSLVPEILASALKAAGAVNAMQLDINPVWVRFIFFSSLGNGQYAYESLLKSMINGGYSYLHGYRKDFFYVYIK